MKYLITSYKDPHERERIEALGLFCYGIRHSDMDWGEPATIERSVLVNRYGSIVTNEELEFNNNDYIDFKDFKENNEEISFPEIEMSGLFFAEELDIYKERFLECQIEKY